MNDRSTAKGVVTERELTSQPEIWTQALALPAEQLALLPARRREGPRHRMRHLVLRRRLLRVPPQRRRHRPHPRRASPPNSPGSTTTSTSSSSPVRAPPPTSSRSSSATATRTASPRSSATSTPRSARCATASCTSASPTRPRSCRRASRRPCSRHCAPRSTGPRHRSWTTRAARSARRCPPNPRRVKHVVFLGHRWSVGLAHEAALKLRESAGAWTEAYPVWEYQHGPISCAGPDSLVWVLGDVPETVAADVRATGATVYSNDLDPQANLVLAHRLARRPRAGGGPQPRHPAVPEPFGAGDELMPVVTVTVAAASRARDAARASVADAVARALDLGDGDVIATFVAGRALVASGGCDPAARVAHRQRSTARDRGDAETARRARRRRGGRSRLGAAQSMSNSKECGREWLPPAPAR